MNLAMRGWKRIVHGIILALSVFASGEAGAQEAGKKECLDQSRVEALFSRFNWGKRIDRAGEPKWVVDACDSSKNVYKVLKALIDLEDYPRLTAKRDGFDLGILGPSVTNFFRQRIKNIYLESQCPPNGQVAFVSGQEPTMYVCPRFQILSSFQAMVLIVHEARHVDGHSHVNCSYGGSKGKPACDASYADKGSYGVGVEFQVRVWRTESLPLATRQEARSAAALDLVNRFETLPLDLKRGMLLEDNDGKVRFLDRDGKFGPVLMSVPGEVIPSSIAFLPLLTDADGGTFKSDFNDNDSGEGQAPLLDAHHSIDFVCRLFANKVECRGRKETSSMKFESIRPLYLVTIDNRIGVSTVGGDIYLLPRDPEQVGRVRERDLEKVPNPYKYINFFSFQKGLYIGLDEDGRLLQTRTFRGFPIEISPPKEGWRLKRAVGPYVWSKQLQSL